MSAAEDALYCLLSDTASVEVLAREQFYGKEASAVVPNVTGRRIVRWCVEQFIASGQQRAPSREAIAERWDEELEAEAIDLGDGTEVDHIDLVIDQLRDQYIRSKVQKTAVKSVETVREADPTERVESVRDVLVLWDGLLRKVTSRRKEIEVGAGVETVAQQYIARRDGTDTTSGLRLGLPQIDDFLHDIRPGEVCTFAAETGVGKSWVAAFVAWTEFVRGRRCVLFTLENDLETTVGRIVCVGAQLNYTRFQAGTLDDSERARFNALREEVEAAKDRIVVVMPRRGERNVHAMMRYAHTLHADSVIIDQLTFIEAIEKHSKKHDEIYEIMHDLKELASEDVHKVSVLLLHQINREGGEHARKHGYYLAQHMSYGSEVERTSDFLFAIFQSEMLKAVEDAEFQLIKSRRTIVPARWLITFRVGKGDIRVQRRIVEDAEVEQHTVAPQLPRGPQVVDDDVDDEDDEL